MAKHFMAVCVVCLLCAEHLPCKDHFDEKTSTKLNFNNGNKFRDNNLYNHNKLNEDPKRYDDQENNNYQKTKNQINLITDNYLINDNQNININKNRKNNKTDETYLRRLKRHSHHDTHHDHSLEQNHDHEINSNSKMFMKKLFERFSEDEKKDTLSLDGFEKMLYSLNLYSLIYDEKSNKENKECISSVELLQRVSSTPSEFDLKNQKYTKSDKIVLNNSNKISTVEPPKINTSISNKIEDLKTIRQKMFLTTNDLLAVCPILLYQMTAETSSEKSGCISENLLPNNIHHFDNHKTVYGEHRGLVWLYSTLSILGVSLCGLLGVAVIPCMEKSFYNQILQFFVALAVGTLTGDALLHLLPHSFSIASQTSDDPHEAMIFKGLIAVLGVIFFYFTERALNMGADWRKNRQKQQKPCSRVRVMRDPETKSPLNGNVDKICKNKYSSYPYCYDEIAMETKDDQHHHHHSSKTCDKMPSQSTEAITSLPILTEKPIIKSNMFHNHDHGDNNDTAQSLLPYNYTINENYAPDSHQNGNKEPNDNNTISTNLEDGSVGSIKEKNVHEENYTIILREHESKHHGHSHTHGHVHSPPSSLSSVAWMVIMGDGLHNFTDGMTIGAAFSNSIAGGFSTAIAVFCHELPHELGDFAVLLKAGMSAKQAVYYNILSSVLSFFGMVLGVLCGERPEASAWIFACAAGLFIYIALVDMMPEITASHKGGCGVSQCCLQFFGMICGLGIMLLIAYFEHDLKRLFTSDHHHHS